MYFDLIDVEYSDFAKFEENEWNQPGVRKTSVFSLVSFFVLIPLSLTDNFAKFRVFSLICSISVFFTMGVILVQSPFFANFYASKMDLSQLNYFDWRVGFTNQMEFLKASGVIFISYFTHISALPVVEAVTNHNTRRSTKIYALTAFWQCFIYLAVGIAGFYTILEENKPDLVILRNNLIVDPDYLILISLALTMIGVMISTVGNFIGLRYAIYSRFFGGNEQSFKVKIAISLSIFLSTLVIAILKSEIIDYLGIAGGYFGIMVMYFIPGMLYNKTVNPKSSTDYLTLFLFGVLFIAGITGATLSLFDLFN